MIKVSDIKKSLDKLVNIENYTPYGTYEYYDGLYDEVSHKIHFAGVIGDDIILGETFKNSPNAKNVHECNSFDELMCTIEQYNIPNIKLQDYSGDLYDIKDVVVDRTFKRVVFIADYKIK